MSQVESLRSTAVLNTMNHDYCCDVEFDNSTLLVSEWSSQIGAPLLALNTVAWGRDVDTMTQRSKIKNTAFFNAFSNLMHFPTR